MSKYLYNGVHSDTLSSGANVAPGDALTANDVNPDAEPEKSWLAEGVLIDTNAHKGSTKKETR